MNSFPFPTQRCLDWRTFIFDSLRIHVYSVSKKPALQMIVYKILLIERRVIFLACEGCNDKHSMRYLRLSEKRSLMLTDEFSTCTRYLCISRVARASYSCFLSFNHSIFFFGNNTDRKTTSDAESSYFSPYHGSQKTSVTKPLDKWMQDGLVSAVTCHFHFSREIETYRRDGKPQGPLEICPEVADRE